jgi:light-regulated signal transduction histidine kinase (bacteriophytochrome)
MGKDNAGREGEFPLIASHELREPLRLLCNYAKLLERRADALNPAMRQYARIIGSNALSLYNMVTSLLEYSQAGMYAGRHEKFDAALAVREALKPVCYLLEEKNAAVTLGALPVMEGDREAFTIIMRNLLANAATFTRPETVPLITVSASHKKDAWVFEVRDNGTGICGEYLESIFLPLRRLHAHAESRGHGLGLALSRKLAEQSGGRLAVRSKEGEGSVFTLSFPVRRVHPAGAHLNPGAEKSSKKEEGGRVEEG